MLRLDLAGRCCAATLACLAATISATAQPANSTLQNAVTRAMAGRRGAAVVLDLGSGRVMAAYHLDVAARRVAHPGSSIKPFTLMALLESGKVDRAYCADVQAPAFHRRTQTGLHPSRKRHSRSIPPTLWLIRAIPTFTTVATRLSPEQLRDSFRAGWLRLAHDACAGRSCRQRCCWRSLHNSYSCRRSASGGSASRRWSWPAPIATSRC